MHRFHVGVGSVWGVVCALSVSSACSPSAASAPDRASGGASSQATTSSGGSGTGGGPASATVTGGASASGGSPSGQSGGVPGFEVGGGGSVGASGGPPTPAGCGTAVIDPTTLPACPSCATGRCVAEADYPNAPAGILQACEGNTVCLPDAIVATKGNVALARCASVLGSEGRCTSLCIPIAQALSAVLPRDVCAPDERCAPCFNPTDASDTGICRIGCDPGPTTAPVLFQKCCTGRGDCVPRADIPGPAAQNLSKEACTGDGDPVCVPSAIVKDPTYRFPACTSSVNVPGVAPGPGVCVPDCIVDANPLGAFLGAGTCQTPGDKCAPCNDPTGKPTGACSAP